ncbi:MAG: gas vesicle protein [Chloroflexi bacterium]|nr:gas vesicle protein [Chloroflexota bacterium]
MALQVDRDIHGTLADVIDRILDKGLVINADIRVSVVGVELLGIQIRAAVASFETAAKYGLEFPSGTRLPQWAGHAESALSRNGAQGLPIPQI